MRTSNRDEPRPRGMNRVRARILIALLVAFTVVGCGNGGDDGGAPRKDGTQLYALLASNELVGVALSPARLTVRLRLGEGLDQASPGRLLATSPDGTTVYVLVRHSQRPSIAVVAAASRRLRMRIPLPPGLDARSLVVAPRSGTLYVLGSREGTRRNEVEGLESNAQLLVVDPDAGRVRTRIELRPLEGRDWFVYSAALAPDDPIRPAPIGLRCRNCGDAAARHGPGPAACPMISTGISNRSQPAGSWPRLEALVSCAMTDPGG
jgi:hypothetical protein